MSEKEWCSCQYKFHCLPATQAHAEGRFVCETPECPMWAEIQKEAKGWKY